MELTTGQRAADWVARFIGSWKFVIGQLIILACWVVVNTLALLSIIRFDPFPFIFMNLALSAQAAFATPLIMMSQNRSAEADREILKKDFLADSETNIIVERIADKLGVDRSDLHG